MSAQELRDAAALMRARAEAASALSEGRWHTVWGWDVCDNDTLTTLAECSEETFAPHIAAADPTVMLAVADWLGYAAEQAQRDTEVDEWASLEGHTGQIKRPYTDAALAVARAYLRSDQ